MRRIDAHARAGRRVRLRLVHWFGGSASRTFCVQTRIHGNRVELRAIHLPSGHLCIASADDFNQAGEALVGLLEAVLKDGTCRVPRSRWGDGALGRTLFRLRNLLPARVRQGVSQGALVELPHKLLHLCLGRDNDVRGPGTPTPAHVEANSISN